MNYVNHAQGTGLRRKFRQPFQPWNFQLATGNHRFKRGKSSTNQGFFMICVTTMSDGQGVACKFGPQNHDLRGWILPGISWTATKPYLGQEKQIRKRKDWGFWSHPFCVNICLVRTKDWAAQAAHLLHSHAILSPFLYKPPRMNRFDSQPDFLAAMFYVRENREAIILDMMRQNAVIMFQLQRDIPLRVE